VPANRVCRFGIPACRNQRSCFFSTVDPSSRFYQRIRRTKGSPSTRKRTPIGAIRWRLQRPIPGRSIRKLGGGGLRGRLPLSTPLLSLDSGGLPWLSPLSSTKNSPRPDELAGLLKVPQGRVLVSAAVRRTPEPTLPDFRSSRYSKPCGAKKNEEPTVVWRCIRYLRPREYLRLHARLIATVDWFTRITGTLACWKDPNLPSSPDFSQVLILIPTLIERAAVLGFSLTKKPSLCVW